MGVESFVRWELESFWEKEDRLLPVTVKQVLVQPCPCHVCSSLDKMLYDMHIFLLKRTKTSIKVSGQDKQQPETPRD